MAHNDVGENGLKRSLNLIWDRTFTCCHLQHNFKTKLHSILLVPVNDGLVTEIDDHREVNCFIGRRNGFAGI